MLITDSFSLSLQQATQGFTASTHFFMKTYQSMGRSGWLDGPERCSISNYWQYFFSFLAKHISDILLNFFGHIFCLQIDIFDKAVLLVPVHLPGHWALGVMSTIVHLPNNL